MAIQDTNLVVTKFLSSAFSSEWWNLGKRDSLVRKRHLNTYSDNSETTENVLLIYLIFILEL